MLQIQRGKFYALWLSITEWEFPWIDASSRKCWPTNVYNPTWDHGTCSRTWSGMLKPHCRFRNETSAGKHVFKGFLIPWNSGKYEFIPSIIRYHLHINPYGVPYLINYNKWNCTFLLRSASISRNKNNRPSGVSIVPHLKSHAAVSRTVEVCCSHLFWQF